MVWVVFSISSLLIKFDSGGILVMVMVEVKNSVVIIVLFGMILLVCSYRLLCCVLIMFMIRNSVVFVSVECIM